MTFKEAIEKSSFTNEQKKSAADMLHHLCGSNYGWSNGDEDNPDPTKVETGGNNLGFYINFYIKDNDLWCNYLDRPRGYSGLEKI